jgi:hypothetical protein
MQYTNRGYFITWHLNQIVANLRLLRVQVTSLYKDLLLLSDSILKQLHPRYDVAMRHRKLVSPTDFDELIETLFVLVLR